jgi:preprotein translocase subunit YajC
MLLLSLLASADDNNGGGASGLINILILLAIPVGMYFLLIRPQRRRQRASADLQRSIEIGDEVMTTSGLYGFVTGFDGDIAWLEIDDNVQIRVARAAIQRKVDTAAGQTGSPTDAALKESRSTEIKPADGDNATKSDDAG